MGLENGKWRVVRGDCLWNIAVSVYHNGYRWTEIANANGISRSRPTIYPGQLFTLPGITSGSGGGGSSPSTPSPAPGARTPTIQWFALDSGTERNMFATWSFSRDHFDHFEVHWEYDTGAGGWRIGSHGTTSDYQSAYSAPVEARRVKLAVKPISQVHDNNVYYWTNGDWTIKEYNFSDNPPQLPPTPSIEIDTYNTLTVEIENIQNDINADSIEIAIYQNDTVKYSTAKVSINSDAMYASYTCTVPAGYEYKVRCRALRGTIYGGWTDFTANDRSRPNSPTEITTLRPQKISEQMSVQYGIFIEWPEITTATNYEVQWTTNIEYFDISNQISSLTTVEGQGPRTLVTGIELGHEYFFRVRSINAKGSSQYWSAIKSVVLGSRPSAPTTWSNTSSSVIGEDLNLYWNHNSTDNSIETYARLNIKIIDSLHPDNAPMEYTRVIENTRPEEERNQTSVYKINSTDAEWSMVQAGFIIKWKVQTSGVASEYSEWSVEREVNVYAQPELELDLTNQNGVSISEVNEFPFYISVLAGPATQIPISYYLEIISNDSYETVDDIGNLKVVNAGDKVYQKYYDPETNAWRFLASMTPGNIDLENNMSYTINCTVSMNSGLSKTSSLDFNVYLNDLFYDVFADILLNRETLEVSIHPYCQEYTEVDGEITPQLSENCKLSVYRREYDGSFTEIATNINNEENLYVTDPHPSLDYARYRVVAKTNDTGAISYSDIQAVKFGEKAVVIQWAEKWCNFETGDDGEGLVEPSWSGSMLKLPYNIDISENKNVDVSLIQYVGRKRPVSYYGTQLNETATWNVVIPKEDVNTLYAVRRLSVWLGDVYVREPSGTGYWANISVSYNENHSDLIIPITFNIKRVEGGI